MMTLEAIDSASGMPKFVSQLGLTSDSHSVTADCTRVLFGCDFASRFDGYGDGSDDGVVDLLETWGGFLT